MTSETDQRVDSVLSKFRETVVARESPVSDTNPFALPPDLAERVATFAAARWPAEPRSIDALSCARRGWKCVGPELLECAGCGRKLQCPASVALPSAPDDPEREIRRRAAGRFAGMLDAEHSGRCLYAEWNYADADLAFPKLPSAENARWLRNRASTWDAVPDNKLPKTLLVGGKPWTEQIPPELLETIGRSLDLLSTPRLLLGLFGYSHHPMGAVLYAARCGFCLRTAGLWMFSTSQRDGEISEFDLEGEHRTWCSWVRGPGDSLESVRDSCGWKITLDSLRAGASEESREVRPRKKIRISDVGINGGEAVLGAHQAETENITLDEATRRIRNALYG